MEQLKFPFNTNHMKFDNVYRMCVKDKRGKKEIL